jgi:hypothetical protein
MGRTPAIKRFGFVWPLLYLRTAEAQSGPVDGNSQFNLMGIGGQGVNLSGSDFSQLQGTGLCG